MKSTLFVLVACFPVFVFGQTIDTVAVKKEVDSLTKEGVQQWRIGNYQDAISFIQQAADISKQTWSENSASYAGSMHRLATVYQSDGQNDKAEELFFKAIDLRGKLLGKEHADYAHSLSGLATVYRLKSDYAKAEPLYLEAIKIYAKVLGKEHRDYAASLSRLAILYFDKGNYAKAEPLFLETKEIYAKVLGKEHPEYAKPLNNLAMLYDVKGEYSKAELMYLESKEILAKTLTKQHPLYAASLVNLAILYYNKGDYAKAESLYLEAIEIYAKVVGKEHPDYASSLFGLAILYYDKGNYAKAEPLLLETKEIRAKVLGKEHPEYAKSLNNIATLYFDKADYAKAEPLYLEAKEIVLKALGKEHLEYATSLNNFAALYHAMGDYDKAEPLYLEAIEILANALGKEHPNYVRYLHILANLYKDKGKYAKAEPLYLKAKEIWAKVLGKEHPFYVSSLNSLALLYQSQHQTDQATEYFIAANSAHRSLIDKTALYSSENEMFAYLHLQKQVFDQFHSFSQIYQISDLNRLSFDNALFLNGFLLDNACRLSHAVEGSDSLTRDAHERWQGCRRRLANEYSKPIAERLHIAELEAEAEGYEKMFTSKLPTFGPMRQVPHWREIKENLQPNEAAIEFISYPYYTPKPTDSTLYAALVLLPTDTMPHFIPLFEERQLQALFTQPGLDEKLIIKNLYGNSPELRRLLWEPLEPLLRSVKTVYYSPAGLLHRLNPAALLDESRKRISEERQWVRVGSTRELVIGRLADRSFARSSDAQKTDAEIPLTALVYGGITYEMDSLAFAAANPLEAVDSTLSFQRKDGNFRYLVEVQFGEGTRGGGDGEWKSLPGSSLETDEVSALLRESGFHIESQKGFFASEEHIKKIGTAGSSPRILHLATHGFAYPDPKKEASKGFGDTEPTYKLMEDPMMRSGLLLAGANFYWKNKRPLTNREDGVLVAYEVRDLNLRNTELAVLSACQTGLGDLVGSEGVYGLQRAFRIAGAKFLIVSLWQVPDEQTQELMRLFYQNFLDKKESLRNAFNHAQQTLQSKEPNPYMWAGFVLVE